MDTDDLFVYGIVGVGLYFLMSGSGLSGLFSGGSASGISITDPQIAAALNTIGQLESSGNYNIENGGGSFSDMSDPPANLGWAGNPLSASACAAAGLPAGCVSTAAGKYQIIKGTWNTYRQDMGDGYGYLPDFSPNSQDIAALRILAATGAIPDIEAGNSAWTTLAAGTWTSLASQAPGSSSLLSMLSTFGGAFS